MTNLRVRNRSVLAALLIGCGAAVVAQPLGAQSPATPGTDQAAVNERMRCIAQHETAQERRLDGRLLDARAALEGCVAPECPEPVRVDCQAWLTEVARNLPTVRLTVRIDAPEAAGTRIFVDGELLPVGAATRPVEVDPGKHRFRFERAGYEPQSLEVEIPLGAREYPIITELHRIPAPVAPSVAPPARVPPGTWVLGGVSLLGALGVVGFGTSALSLAEDRQERCAPLCSEDDRDDLRTRAIFADLSLGVAITAAAGATLLVLTRKPPPPSAARAYTLEARTPAVWGARF